jgi:hypothetical protein
MKPYQKSLITMLVACASIAGGLFTVLVYQM